jgi:hypothetical protein
MPNPRAAVEKFFDGGGAGGATGFLLVVTFLVAMKGSIYFFSNTACIFLASFIPTK